MASSIEINISDQVRFFGSLIGTVGLSEDNNRIANNYLFRYLKALEPFVKDYEDEATEMIKNRIEDEERAGKIIMEPTEGDFANLKILKD